MQERSSHEIPGDSNSTLHKYAKQLHIKKQEIGAKQAHPQTTQPLLLKLQMT